MGEPGAFEMKQNPYRNENAYLLHLRTITITIAPNRAEIIETIIKVKVHPSSPAASEIRFKWDKRME